MLFGGSLKGPSVGGVLKGPCVGGVCCHHGVTEVEHSQTLVRSVEVLLN